MDKPQLARGNGKETLGLALSWSDVWGKAQRDKVGGWSMRQKAQATRDMAL